MNFVQSVGLVVCGMAAMSCAASDAGSVQGGKEVRPAVLFSSGAFSPPAGERIQPALSRLAAASVGRAGGRLPAIYGLIMFDGPVMPATQSALSKLGVTLLSYFPENCRLARLPAAQLTKVSAVSGVVWMGQPTPQQKLAPRLAPFLGYPAKQTALVFISFYADDADGSARTALRAVGIEARSYDKGLAVAAASVTPSTLKAALDLNAVWHIEPVPSTSIDRVR
jgi:hypothetical protein